MLANDVTSVLVELWPNQIDLMAKLLANSRIFAFLPAWPRKSGTRARSLATDPGRRFVLA
jgi:hypothetical protein